MKATDREKAILFVLAAGQLPGGWKQAYILSAQKPEEEITAQKAINTTVSRWKNRPDIIAEYQNAVKIFQTLTATKPATDKTQTDSRTDDNQGNRDGDSESTNKRGRPAVDYYSPEAQRRTINAIIDRSQDDPKTQLDAIKAIQQTQRDDRQAAKDNQIQRFYTPVTCNLCPMYQKRKK